MKPVPSIQKYMSTTPVSIGDEQTLATAQVIMQRERVRHLPVLHAGKLVGVVSERDINLVQTFRDVEPDKVEVSEAMSRDPFTVPADAPLDEVVREMAERKYGSAVILDNDKVVGIFTTVDACAALAELLGTRLRK